MGIITSMITSAGSVQEWIDTGKELTEPAATPDPGGHGGGGVACGCVAVWRCVPRGF